MLYNYPIAATDENWLHQCLVWMILGIHEDARAGRGPAAWPDSIPLAAREKLKARHGLRRRLAKYETAYKALPPSQQKKAHLALISQNRIRRLLDQRCDPIRIDDRTKPIFEAVEQLFEFAFSLLTPLGIRDRHYTKIYQSSKDHICPFCGLSYFDAPTGRRHALDHYLPKSRYPFTASNLRNLVPMCDRCNSSYKHTDDVLFDAGTRRCAFDPYSSKCVSVCLLNSTTPAGAMAEPPVWVVDFLPRLPESDTWDSVFSIRQRYIRDHLNAHYFYWLGEFGKYCKAQGNASPSVSELLTMMSGYIKVLKYSRLRDRAFLKAAVFEFLRAELQGNNARLTKQVQQFI